MCSMKNAIRQGALTLIAGLALLAGFATPRTARAADDGSAPYTPTKAEWLCLVLNTQVALVTAEQQPDGLLLRYVCDPSKPNTVVIETLRSPTATPLLVERQAAQAEQWLAKAAKARGWDGWLKVEFRRKQIDGPPDFGTVEP